MAKGIKLIVKMAYEVYYGTEYARTISESEQNEINKYLEKYIQRNMQQISDISEEFISPSRYYNVMTTFNIVKRKPRGCDKHYKECNIYLKGVNAYIKYNEIMENIKNKVKPDFRRFIIGDITSKNGFIAEEVGKYLFSNSENIIKQYLFYKLNLMDKVKPTLGEKICFLLIYPIKTDKFIKNFIYSRGEEIENSFDLLLGDGKFNYIINLKDRKLILQELIKMRKKELSQIKQNMEDMGYVGEL